jgi:hypothetical protein
MVCRRMSLRFAGDLGFVHNLDEVLPLRLPKQVLKVAGKPELDPGTGLLSVRFEMLGQRVNQFGLHIQRPKVGGALIGGPGSVDPTSGWRAERPALSNKKAESLYQGPRF